MYISSFIVQLPGVHGIIDGIDSLVSISYFCVAQHSLVCQPLIIRGRPAFPWERCSDMSIDPYSAQCRWFQSEYVVLTVGLRTFCIGNVHLSSALPNRHHSFCWRETRWILLAPSWWGRLQLAVVRMFFALYKMCGTSYLCETIERGAMLLLMLFILC